MVGIMCSVSGCRQSKRKSNISFHKFPTSIETCLQWVRLCGNKNLLGLTTEYIREKRHVCTLHFPESVKFRRMGQNRYVLSNPDYTVPSLLLPQPIDIAGVDVESRNESSATILIKSTAASSAAPKHHLPSTQVGHQTSTQPLLSTEVGQPEQDMEEPSSRENQMAMAPVIGNMAHLCLLCAEAQSPEEEPFIDVYGELGKQLNIVQKIYKFLTIAIEAGFPLQVCVACVDKLNMCHELVQSSEKAHEKFKSLRDEWQANQETGAKDELLDDMGDAAAQMDANAPSPESLAEWQELESEWQSTGTKEEYLNDMEDASSQMDVDVPSSQAEFPTESQELETEQQPSEKSSTMTLNEGQLQKYLSLQQTCLVVNGSQTAIFVAEEVAAVKVQYRLGLVLINMDVNSKETTREKVDRIIQLVKKRFASKQGQFVDNEKSISSSPLYSCQSCKCSFFLQEEMVSHFESLHPEEVLQCTVCDEKICGPVQMQEKHMDLHLALETDQIDDLLTTLQVSSVSNTNMFDPEFVVVQFGELPPSLNLKLDEILHSELLKCIQRNIWIKPDMKDRLIEYIKLFIFKVKYRRRVRNRRVDCDICGKKIYKVGLKTHMNSKHNPEKIQCGHCKKNYMFCNENSHIESHHNGGEILVCNICDSNFSASGENQPHMTHISDFPFKCFAKSCRKVYQTKENLKNHIQTEHVSKPDKPDTPPCLCDLCGKVYTDARGLRQHFTFVHFPNRNAVYACELCEVTYSKKAYLKRHIIAVHEPKVSCKVCGKLVTGNVIYRHMRIHNDEAKFPCKYCGKLYTSRPTCRVHEQSRHENVQIRCSICPNLYFKSIKGMEEHRLKHERGEEIILPPYLRPVQCTVCSKTFVNSVKLTSHMKTHNNNNKNNKKEENSNTEGLCREPTFPCRPCLMRFMTQECYDKHVETHHPDGVPYVYTYKPKISEFRYQCRYCEKNFRKKTNCNDHESLHGFGERHACNCCGKRFRYYVDKWAHQRKCRAEVQQ